MTWVLMFILMIGLLVGVPIAALYFEHQRKMAEIKQRSSMLTDDARRAIDDLRRQVMELRETATQFDLSQDAAVERLAQRLDRVERRLALPAPEEAEERRRLTGGES